MVLQTIRMGGIKKGFHEESFLYDKLTDIKLLRAPHSYGRECQF